MPKKSKNALRRSLGMFYNSNFLTVYIDHKFFVQFFQYHQVYFAIEKCREMQLKMQRFATHLIPFRQCVGQSIALAMKRDDMGVMN